MHPDIHSFYRIEVPTISEDGARDAFYGLCNPGRSSVVDDLIARLDFPLSINLLVNSLRESGWDGSAPLKAWGEDQTSVPENNCHQTLEGTVGPVFRSPTIQELRTTALNGRDSRYASQVLTHLSPRLVREGTLTVLVLIRDVAGTCGACGSYTLGC